MTAGTLSGCAIAAITLPPAGRFNTNSFLSGQGTKWIMFSRAAAHSIDIEELSVIQLPVLNAPDISLDATSQNWYSNAQEAQ